MSSHQSSTSDSEADLDFVFFEDSEMWKLNRVWLGILFGPAAAILQTAHPRVAQGVAQHSDFQKDSLARLRRTLFSVTHIAFGTRQEAAAMAEMLEKIHARVRGEIAEGMPGERQYSAFEPELQMWVLATLVVAALDGYELVMDRLDDARREHFYRDFRDFGVFFGLDRNFGPQDFPSFAAYYEQMLADPMLGEHAVCAEVAQAVVYPRAPWWIRPLGLLSDFLPIETLPPRVRDRLGLRSTWWTRLRMRVFRRVIPCVYPLLPRRLQLYPAAYKAERRIQRAGIRKRARSAPVNGPRWK